MGPSLHLGRWLLVYVALLMGVLGCSSQPNERVELLVFAATSLTDALTEIGSAFEEQTGISVSFSFGGSQLLAQQIAQGAPADLFIAAGAFPVESLAERRLVEPGAVNILSNKLVVVTRLGGVELRSLEDLRDATVQRVAMAHPDLAPAGRYARESLSRLGLWESLEGKLVMAEDVRVALAYVQAGNADAALVYQTDAMAVSGVVLLDLVPPDSYSQIVYPAAVVERSEKKEQATRFLSYLRGERAAAIFRRHGFEPLEP